MITNKTIFLCKEKIIEKVTSTHWEKGMYVYTNNGTSGQSIVHVAKAQASFNILVFIANIFKLKLMLNTNQSIGQVKVQNVTISKQVFK